MSVNDKDLSAEAFSAAGDRYFHIATLLREEDQYDDALKYYRRARCRYTISAELNKIDICDKWINDLQPIVDGELEY